MFVRRETSCNESMHFISRISYLPPLFPLLFRFLRSTRRGIINNQSPRNGKSGRRWFNSFNYGQSVNHGGRFNAFHRVNRFDETNLSLLGGGMCFAVVEFSAVRDRQPILSSIFPYPSSPPFRLSPIIYAENLIFTMKMKIIVVGNGSPFPLLSLPSPIPHLLLLLIRYNSSIICIYTLKDFLARRF